MSESGYNAVDVNLNYQYRAFSIPNLKFKRGLTEDLVIAPYASAEVRATAEEDVEPEDVALRRDLVRLLKEHDGNVSEVARAMGKARMQVHRWMKRLSIEPETFRR